MPRAEAGGNGDGVPQPEQKPKKVTARQYRLYELLKQAGKEKFDTWQDIAAAPDVPSIPLVGNWLSPGAWLFVGKSKSGKGWLELQMANAVLTGGEFLGWHCRQAEVLCVFAEDTNDRIKNRLKQLGITDGLTFQPPPGCHVINRKALRDLVRRYNSKEAEVHLSFESFLSQWLKERPKVRLVLIDTEVIIRLRWKRDNEPESRGKRITEIDYEQSSLWDDFATESGLVVVLVNHPGKEAGYKRDPHEMINTSGSKMAGAEGSIVLYRPKEVSGNQFVISIKGRDLPEGQIDLAVHQDDSGAFVADGSWQQVSQTLTENQQLEALRVQWQGRPGEWCTSKDLAEYLNKSQTAVARTFSRMLAKGNVTWKGFRLISQKSKGYRLEQMETADIRTPADKDVGDSDDLEASGHSDRSDISW